MNRKGKNFGSLVKTQIQKGESSGGHINRNSYNEISLQKSEDSVRKIAIKVSKNFAED